MATSGDQDIETQITIAAAICSREGVRFTELRRKVLSLILEADKPLTAYKLLDRLRESHKSAVPMTIYRALDFLLDMKLIRRVERLGAFVSCAHPGLRPYPVELLVCRNCGAVAEVEDESVAQVLLHAAGRQGFRLGPAAVELEGICADCAQAF